MNAFEDRNIGVELADDGVLVATIDMPGRSMNVFSAELMDSLDRLIDWVVAARDVDSVVLASGKAAFIAGADLEMVRMFTERARCDAPADLHRLCGRLGRIFRRVELSQTPYVAAVQGLALGGGLELALACRHRVLAEGTQVGLPEVKLGLLPGAGGTQRLPRLIGRRAALAMILTGEQQTASDALDLGIVQEILPASELVAGARRRAAALVGHSSTAPWDLADWRSVGGAKDLQPADVDAFAEELGISREQRRLYPAYDAILSCVIGGAVLPIEAACDWEMDCFVELIRNPVAGNMIRALFLDRQRAAKAIPAASSQRPRAVVLGGGAAAVAKLLEASRIEVVESSAESAAITVLTAGARNPNRRALAWLCTPADSPRSFGVAAGVWLSEPTAHGRAVEVSLDDCDSDASIGLELARWLRGTPLITRGAALLPRLAAVSASAFQTVEERLLAVALEAARVWSGGAIFDFGIADSAAVISGLHPPYTGGPFTFLRQHGTAAVRLAAAAVGSQDGSLFAVPGRLDDLVAALNAGAR